MSSLLEQAIVDAAALREVAIKSAEASLLDKYSKEFQENLNKLLEAEDPAVSDTEQEATPGLDDAMAQASGGEDPFAGGDMGAPPAEEPIKDVPSSFLDGDDDEIITIDFDEIKKQISSALGTPDMGGEDDMGMGGLETPEAPEAAAAPAPMQEEEELDETYDDGLKQDMAKDALYEEDGDEETELEEALNILIGDDEEPVEFDGELAEEGDPAAAEQQAQQQLAQAQAKKSQNDARNAQDVSKAQLALSKAKASGIEQKSASEKTLDQAQDDLASGLELTAEELTELAEAFEFDYDATRDNRGYMGTTNSEIKRKRNMELADAQDAEATEERAKEQEEMSNLKEKLKETAKQNKKLASTINEMSSTLLTLKEHVEKVNLSNAKLLYTNKALGNTSLNERQKEQVVETISRAKSVQEAKTIYDTLQGAVASVKETKAPKSLSEALNRGQSPFLARKQVSSQDDNFTARMQRLAGIK